jgi:hypothetical protein
METGCRAEEEDDCEQVSRFPGVGRSNTLPGGWGDEGSSKMGWLIFLRLSFCSARPLTVTRDRGLLFGRAGIDSMGAVSG